MSLRNTCPARGTEQMGLGEAGAGGPRAWRMLLLPPAAPWSHSIPLPMGDCGAAPCQLVIFSEHSPRLSLEMKRQPGLGILHLSSAERQGKAAPPLLFLSGFRFRCTALVFWRGGGVSAHLGTKQKGKRFAQGGEKKIKKIPFAHRPLLSLGKQQEQGRVSEGAKHLRGFGAEVYLTERSTLEKVGGWSLPWPHP